MAVASLASSGDEVELLAQLRLSVRFLVRHLLQVLAIRRNVTTSSWRDVQDPVAANNATVLDPASAGIPSSQFQGILNELADKGPESCTISRAVMVGEDSVLKLQLQSLLSNVASLNGQPLTLCTSMNMSVIYILRIKYMHVCRGVTDICGQCILGTVLCLRVDSQ
jgi:hypothetical protein